MESIVEHIKRLDREISKMRNMYLEPANERHIGIMQAQDKRDLSHALGQREWLYEAQDVLKMKPGRYAGSAQMLIHTPIPDQEGKDGAPYVELDITKDGDRKQYWFLISGTGELFYFNQHNSPSGLDYTPKTWQTVPKEAWLWRGSIQNVGETIKLVDNLDNYTSLLIRYAFFSEYHVKKIQIPSDSITVRDFNLPNQSTAENWISFCETTLTKVDSQTLKLSSVNPITANLIGAIKVDSNNLVITGIEGVR